jgi:tRNA:m4X modification enzyme
MDLSLDSLTATIPEQVHGICISTCCHHLCSLREYVGQAMFDRLKWTTEEVEAAIALSSWATLKNTSDDHNDAAKTAPNMIEPSSSELESSALNEHSPETAGDAADCSSQTSLTVQQRIELGYRCKRLLDQGRCEFLQAAGFQTALECFTQCSRENVALVAFR